MAISGTSAVEADGGGWVHFGPGHFSFMMMVINPSPQMDEEDLPAELHSEYGELRQGSSGVGGALTGVSQVLPEKSWEPADTFAC